MDPTNRFDVATFGDDKVIIRRPPWVPMSRAEALGLVVCIVASAKIDPDELLRALAKARP